MRLKLQSERDRSTQPMRFNPSESLPLLPHDEVLSIRDSLGDYFDELTALFLEDSPKRIAAMRHASAQRDLTALAGVTHALNGSAASYGARGLAALCRNLSRNLKAGIQDSALASLESIEAEYARLEARLRTFEPARPGRSQH